MIANYIKVLYLIPGICSFFGMDRNSKALYFYKGQLSFASKLQSCLFCAYSSAITQVFSLKFQICMMLVETSVNDVQSIYSWDSEFVVWLEHQEIHPCAMKCYAHRSTVHSLPNCILSLCLWSSGNIAGMAMCAFTRHYFLFLLNTVGLPFS